MSHRAANDAEPGTGTQYHVLADEDEESHRIDGMTATVGRTYYDRSRNDTCVIHAIVRKSSWCDARPAEKGRLEVQFEYDNPDVWFHQGRPKCNPTSTVRPDDLEADPELLSFSERFVELRNQQPRGRP